MTRQPSVSVALRCNMRRSRHQRKAVRVLPVPVGARIRVLSPRAIGGQPSRCGAVGCSKTARNQAAVTGWKRARTSSVRVGFLTAMDAALRIAVKEVGLLRGFHWTQILGTGCLFLCKLL